MPRGGFPTKVGMGNIGSMMSPEATPLRACNVNPFTPEAKTGAHAATHTPLTATPGTTKGDNYKGENQRSPGSHRNIFSALLFSESSPFSFVLLRDHHPLTASFSFSLIIFSFTQHPTQRLRKPLAPHLPKLSLMSRTMLQRSRSSGNSARDLLERCSGAAIAWTGASTP